MSTLLRMLAGLEEIDGGAIAIDGKVVNDTESKDRDIAMVFQSYALYPHMTVRDNMSIRILEGPRRSGRRAGLRGSEWAWLQLAWELPRQSSSEAPFRCR